MWKLFFLFTALHSFNVLSSDSFKSLDKMTIEWIETGWSSEGFVIQLNQNVRVETGGPNCEWQSSIFIPRENPMMKENLSIALAAQASNKKVMVVLEKDCYGYRPVMKSIQIWTN